MTISLTSSVSSDRLWPTIEADKIDTTTITTSDTYLATKCPQLNGGKIRQPLKFDDRIKSHGNEHLKTSKLESLSLISKINTISFYVFCLSCCFVIGCQSAPIKPQLPTSNHGLQMVLYPKTSVPSNSITTGHDIDENNQNLIINRDHQQHPWRWRLSKSIDLIRPGKNTS